MQPGQPEVLGFVHSLEIQIQESRLHKSWMYRLSDGEEGEGFAMFVRIVPSVCPSTNPLSFSNGNGAFMSYQIL
jgi:hypothetical protein